MIGLITQLGLGTYESRAISALLKERLSLRDLSKKAGIPFGKVYSVIKSLKEKRIIEETNTRPKLIFIDNASELISRLVSEKQKRDSLYLDELRALAVSIDSSKKKSSKLFEIGTTHEDNLRIQSRTFLEAENEILQIINLHHKPSSNRKSKLIWEKQIREALSRGVIIKAIYPEKAELPSLLQELHKKHPDKFQIRRIDTAFTRCDIIDSKKVMLKLTFTDPLLFGGIIFLENESLASNIKQIFNSLWEHAEKRD